MIGVDSMKSVFRVMFIFFIVVLFFSARSVLAFNTNLIDISDDINVIFSDVNTVKVRLNKNVSNVIYYQFINSSERDLIKFEQLNDDIDSKYAQCSKSAAECAEDYNYSKAKLSDSVPMFNDSDWSESISDSNFHNLSSEEYSNYWLWIKSKDLSGKEIYAVFYKIGGAYIEVQDISSVDSYNSRFYVYNSLAKASMAFSGIGLSTLVFSIGYLLYEKKYGVL